MNGGLFELRRSPLIGLIQSIALPTGFLALVAWFHIADIYHQHFFDNGWLITAYNAGRIVFILYLAWLIYFVGIFTLRFPPSMQLPANLPLAERLVFGFAAGLGIWQLLMLMLGLFGLFNWPLMAGLGTVLLCASITHFRAFVDELSIRTIQQVKSWRSFDGVIHALCSCLLLAALLLLLLTRGLYPGGGHDYYTHYFYYYHDVIANHGLAPNDVWYHYYYSKGAGLFFFSILLTDLQAPELSSFCCVAFASMGIAAVIARAAPNSCWPAVGATLYLLFYIVPLAGKPYAPAGPGGEFQKWHEVTSTCTVLVVCLICLYQQDRERLRWPSLVAVASTITAANLLTVVAGVFLGTIFFVATLVAILQRSMRSVQFFGALWICSGVGIAAILLLNYLTTGLASDQILDVMWLWSNVERLNDWGVLPLVFAGAWIRDNYSETAVPFGLPTLQYLGDLVRWTALWPVITVGLAAAALGAWRSRRDNDVVAAPRSIFVWSAFFSLGFMVLSVLIGRSQTFSFFRFSTFFFPLLLVVAIVGWTMLSASFRSKAAHRLSVIYLPPLVLIGTLCYWQTSYNWIDQTKTVAMHSLRFLVGTYSLAQAYSQQENRGGFSFGAIYPGARDAMRQVGPGTRIWSMHTHTYCLVPECRIESVLSFKLSRHLNEILNGSADDAVKILQKEGLNYFLVSKELFLVDFLQYSNLFAPDAIAAHLAIKWTDGTTYLLTWPGSDAHPITPEFLSFYRQKVEAEKHAVFNFANFVPQLDRAMKRLEETPHPWKPIEFPWRQH